MFDAALAALFIVRNSTLPELNDGAVWLVPAVGLRFRSYPRHPVYVRCCCLMMAVAEACPSEL